MIAEYSCRRHSVTSLLITLAASLIAATFAAGSEPSPAKDPSFEEDILPILSANCLKCHAAGKPKGGLDLRTIASALKGGSGGPALVQGAADKSLLFEKISAGEMPPGKAKLAEADVRLIHTWIDTSAPAARTAGAVARRLAPVRKDSHWAFRPPGRPAIPHVRAADRVRTPVDAFVLARLEAKGLTLSADADRGTLLRRVYFDLLGLPPAPEDVDSFLADGRPDAYERLLDRLFASAHFGERWARHWLDVVGYADTVGFDGDANNIIMSEGKWRYRDYVIDAFNTDKPFDRFVTEQLAGDELVDWRNAATFSPETRNLLIATGFLRTARDQTHEPESNIPLSYYGVLHDTVAIVGNSLLGLTTGCAQCHDHKFDPISQKEYYQLMAVFTPAYNPKEWKPVFPWKAGINDRGIPDISPAECAEIDRHNQEIDTRVEELKRQLTDIRRPCEARLREARFARLPESIRADIRVALETAAGKRSEVQKYLAGKFEPSLRISPEEVTAALNSAEKPAVANLQEQIAALDAGRRSYGKIQALCDVGPPPRTFLLKRGNFENPGEEVQPGFLSVLSEPGGENEILSREPRAAGPTSGRRLALARWLTEPNSRASALLARVMMNRLWQHTFGKGQVPSSENFGLSGEPPSHPELLEWLSSEFVRTGWRVKPILKLLMTSTAYRQSSRSSLADAGGSAADPRTVDPSNSLYWHMPLRRLDAEAIRDAVLTVSGQLDPTAGGPPIRSRANPDGMVVVDAKSLPTPSAANRRSIYLLFRRAYNLSFLSVFDQPLVSINCPRRDASAVTLQSLTMLNDAFVADQAKHFAGRIARCGAISNDGAIRAAYRLALARQPDSAEMTICTQLLDRQAAAFRAAGRLEREANSLALEHLCHTILNTSEFLYLE
jgi:mono/diheme cytochrome c family protein